MIIDGWEFERLNETTVRISENGFPPYEKVKNAFETQDPNDDEFWERFWAWYVPIAERSRLRASEKFYGR